MLLGQPSDTVTVDPLMVAPLMATGYTSDTVPPFLAGSKLLITNPVKSQAMYQDLSVLLTKGTIEAVDPLRQ